MGQPFMPVRGIVGTDYLKIRPDFKVIDNPYGDDQVVLIPAIRPDISIIHSFAADDKGNVLVDEFENEPLLARASRRVFVSTEEIVSTKELKNRDYGIIIPSLYIDGVVLMPGGATPTRCRNYYPYDEAEIKSYLKAAKEKESFKEYIGKLLATGGVNNGK